MQLLTFFSVESLPAICIVLLVLSALASMIRRRHSLTKQAEFATSTLLLTIIAASSLYMIATGINTVVFGLFHLYAFSLAFLLLFSIALVLVNTLAYVYAPDYADFSLMFAFAASGFLIVTLANSILTIVIGLELATIASVFMILGSRGKHIEPAVKLFIMSAIAVSLLLVGITLIFPYNGTLALAPLTANSAIGGGYLIMLAIILLVSSLAAEAAIFPFNLWIADVYQGAPSHVSAMLAGINKKVAFVALMYVSFIVFIEYTHVLSPLFSILAIATMLFGNIVAMAQNNVKRLFAYSSIAQAGYIMIGLATASAYGIEASIFQIFVHAFMIIGAFAIVLWLESHNITSISDYTGLNSRNKFAALALSIIALSLIGIPPLAGFYGKFLLFSGAINSNMLILAVIGILASLLSIYYYVKLIVAMYSNTRHAQISMDIAVLAVVFAALAVIMVFGIYPQPLVHLSSIAANALLGIPHAI